MFGKLLYYFHYTMKRMREYYAQYSGKVYYAITSRDAMENDTTQRSI